MEHVDHEKENLEGHVLTVLVLQDLVVSSFALLFFIIVLEGKNREHSVQDLLVVNEQLDRVFVEETSHLFKHSISVGQRQLIRLLQSEEEVKHVDVAVTIAHELRFNHELLRLAMLEVIDLHFLEFSCLLHHEHQSCLVVGQHLWQVLAVGD